MTTYLTLSYKNQFTFTCPIFNTDTKLAACMMLRDKVWRGERVEVRQGCQVAMKSSMCPAAALVQLYSFNKAWDNDFHASREPKRGKLHALVLDRISRVLPIDAEVGRHPISQKEKELLYSARQRIEAQLKTAPGERPERPSDYEPPAPTKKKRATKKAAPKTSVTEAAKTGDLAAAINAQG